MIMTVSAVLRQHGWCIEMHTVGSSGDGRQTVISSALPLRIRANDIDHKPHYRPVHDSTEYPEHVNGVVFACLREACWFLDQITRHFHIQSFSLL